MLVMIRLIKVSCSKRALQLEYAYQYVWQPSKPAEVLVTHNQDLLLMVLYSFLYTLH